MGVEVATYVSDLVSSNPLAGDLRAQGDDHLRLVKAVLQSTFPGATHAFRFPGSLAAKTTGYTVVLGDDSKVIPVDATSGPLTITLPANAGIHDGFYVLVIKTDSTSNAVTIDGNGSDPINGELTQELSTQYGWMLVWWADGDSTWYGFGATASVRNIDISSTDLNSLLTSGDYDGTSGNAPTRVLACSALWSWRINHAAELLPFNMIMKDTWCGLVWEVGSLCNDCQMRYDNTFAGTRAQKRIYSESYTNRCGEYRLGSRGGAGGSGDVVC
jgi:hypothetical protein